MNCTTPDREMQRAVRAVVEAHRPAAGTLGPSKSATAERMRFDAAKVSAWGTHRARLAMRLSRGEIDLRDGVIRAHQPRPEKVEILNVESMSISFGGVHALQGVDLTARTGEVTGVIGPNGAGKTTLFNCLSGLAMPDNGKVMFDGRRLHGSPLSRARHGMSRTFQTPRLFRSLSILDNLILGCETADRARLSYVFDPSLSRLNHPKRAERVARLVGYTGDLETPAGSLAFGNVRVVELARALCAAPRLLMLDEPASGLDADQARDLVSLLRSLADMGLAVLLIEHDMTVVMEVCEQISVLDFGAVIARGTPEDVQRSQDVIDAYLGRAE